MVVTRKWIKLFCLCCHSATLPLLPFPSLTRYCHLSVLYNILFFWQRVTSSLCPVGHSPFSISLQPLLPLSIQLSYCPSLPHWISSVILPILFPLTRGMTKTVSHLFQAHLYPLYKCIRQPLLCETEYIEWNLFLMTQGHVHEHQWLFCPIQL